MTTDNNQSHNDNFFEFFTERLNFVKTNCLDRIEGKILLCSYIDSLSGYMYGGGSNANRFRKFLIDCTKQSGTWQKVSLILLKQFIENKNLKIYHDLISVLNRFQASTSSFINLNHNPDVTIETLMGNCREHIPCEVLQTFSNEIKRFEYTSILWNAYRNASVHETAVQLNEAMNLADHTVPYYSNENIIDIECKKVTSSTTRFAIPSSFLVESIESGLDYIRESIDSGKLVLSLSQPYDEPKVANEPIETSKELKQESINYPRMITKPFQSFLADVDNLLIQAEENHKKFKTTDDGKYKWLENGMSRSAIISSVFSLESLVNCIILDFPKRVLFQLPEKILKRVGLLNTAFERIPLINRICLVPYLCCIDESKIVQGFFDKGSTEFQMLKELIKIRDKFAHSYPISRRLKLSKASNGDGYMDDNFPENYWSITKIPKDIFIVDHTHAKKAKGIVDWVIEELDGFLDGRLTNNDWMKNERIEFDPRK